MVEIVHWNPRRYRARGPLHRLPAFGPRMNNFGDLLGPLIVERLLSKRGLVHESASKARLLVVGSILTLARPGDIVWGAGVNGKSLKRDVDLREVNFNAVRGPLTAEWARSRGAQVPDVFGDPGVLLGVVFGREELRGTARSRAFSVVPNFHDYKRSEGIPELLNPRAPLPEVLAGIASSDFVCGSSLHGVIVAEALGIPARFIASEHEPRFKYDDYMFGTGRSKAVFAASVDEAIAMGGQEPPTTDPRRLLDAFPIELWRT